MKKYWYLLIILVIGIMLALFNNNQILKRQGELQEIEPQEFKTNLTIDYGNGNSNTYEVLTKHEDTAFSILKSETERQGIYLETQHYDFGVFVKKIGDLESGPNKSWIYYVNSVSGDKSADLYTLKEDDSVIWKYEVPKY